MFENHHATSSLDNAASLVKVSVPDSPNRANDIKKESTDFKSCKKISSLFLLAHQGA